MIPQRNISLISNTLMTAGGRRIPEAVIERDYVLAFSVCRIGCWDLSPRSQVGIAPHASGRLSKKKQSGRMAGAM
jgi:hypothetical protein